MGWLYMRSIGTHFGPRQYLDNQFTSERPELRCRVLRSALVSKRVYYAAVEFLRPGVPREVAAIVCLVRYNPRDRDGYVFGYKDMDEGMGPCEAECPEAILDLLTPTDRPYALAWRARSRENAAAKQARAAKPGPSPVRRSCSTGRSPSKMAAASIDSRSSRTRAAAGRCSSAIRKKACSTAFRT
jgi:hypothetical protein